MDALITGQAHVYGDNVDTDRIIPGKYTKTLDPGSLAAHVLEDLDPSFRDRMTPGDIVVGADNFGCGSSREQAPVALKVAGVSVVVARYFARIFYRNAINIGLPVVEAPSLAAETGDVLQVDLAGGTVRNLTQGTQHPCTPMPQVMLDILSAGGLAPIMKTHGGYPGALNQE